MKMLSSNSTPSTLSSHSTSTTKRVLKQMNDLQLKKKPKKMACDRDEHPCPLHSALVQYVHFFIHSIGNNIKSYCIFLKSQATIIQIALEDDQLNAWFLTSISAFSICFISTIFLEESYAFKVKRSLSMYSMSDIFSKCLYIISVFC